MPTDKYAEFVRGPVGGFIAPKVGLPQPTKLERYKKGQPVVAGKAFIGAAPGGRLGESLVAALKSANVEFEYSEPGVAPEGDERFKVLVFDATGITDSTQLEELWRFFHPTIRRVKSCGRVVVLGTQPELTGNAKEATAQRALEGFTRAVGKEIRKGSAVNLVYVAPGAEDQIESTLRFFISPRSAYVSGQVARIVESIGGDAGAIDWNMPLAGKVALVTGASRGIGASISETLARDGAHVVGLDIPPLKEDLEKLMAKLGGSSIVEDITAEDAPKVIADFLAEHHNGVDIVVHNAGVTKDKTLGRMDEDKWSVLMDINLSSEERINDELLARQLVKANGRVICVSSMSGIAGGAGQTNYSTSKAGVIGLVQSTAPEWAKHGVTINAVAPGFIETQMTAAMPMGPREVGRRMNSMQQGGLPVDVAEGIAWYASPASTGLTGNVVRVCGQMLIGA
ncbi:MAG: 3-oxoacyl-ACP reductase [Solirubrobacterales bacterium]|nr:3-oxoacyl-ACP reductase [Solirubrobacterales bacterium]